MLTFACGGVVGYCASKNATPHIVYPHSYILIYPLQLLTAQLFFLNITPTNEVAEGNIFICVCLSVSLSTGGVPCDITHDVLDLTVQPLPAQSPPQGPTPLTPQT